MKPKYKAGDVLQTKAGTVFIIEKVNVNGIYSSAISSYEGIYRLKNHKYSYLPIEYIDNAAHIFPATKAGKILFGVKRGK